MYDVLTCDQKQFLGDRTWHLGSGIVCTYQESLSEQGPKSIYFTLKAVYFQWGWETMYYVSMYDRDS